MQILFQVDLRGLDYFAELGQTLDEACVAEAAGEPDVAEFARGLVAGTLEQRAGIDQRLQAVTRNWDLRRMANVDRNVLRMAVYELTYGRDVPPKVAINEAIELAKKYSTANSGGFVNGILDRVRLDLEQERRAAAAPAGSGAVAPRAAAAGGAADSDRADSGGVDSGSVDSADTGA